MRPDVRGTFGPGITWMIWNRRAKDTAGPRIRWAEATIAASPVLRSVPREEQVAYFARLMAGTTIGRHPPQRSSRPWTGAFDVTRMRRGAVPTRAATRRWRRQSARYC